MVSANTSENDVALKVLYDVLRIAEELPSKMKMAFQYRHVWGLDSIEIGERLGIDRAQARFLLSKAQSIISKIMEGELDKPDLNKPTL